MIRVSYLITTRNRANYLERTFENVREFIEPQDELIVIDGGSTDSTKEVVHKNRDLITIFVSEKDCGEGHAFNRGLFRARGRFLKPITDDDYFYPEAMRELIRQMESHPDVEAMLCGGETWQMRDGQPVFTGFRYLPAGVAPTPEVIFDHTAIGLGLICRKSAFERTGGVSTNYASVDGDLIVRLIECQCNIRYLDVNLYKWFIHPHSGFNKVEAFRKENLLFAVRLGRWERIFCHDPETLADIIGYRNRPGGLEQLYGVWAMSFFSRTPARIIPYAAGRLLKRIQLWRRSFRGDGRKPCDLNASAPREWTGLLR